MQAILKKYKFSVILLDQITISATSFATQILLIRFWNTSTYGKYSYFFLIHLLLLSFQTAIIISPTLSLTPKMDPPKAKLFMVHLHYLQFIFSGIILPLFLILSFLKVFDFNTNSHLTIPAFFAMMFFRFYYEFLRKAYIVRDKTNLLLKVDLFTSISMISCILFLEHLSLLSISHYFIALSIILCFGIIFLQPQEMIYKTNIHNFKKDVKHIITFGKWLFATAGLQWFCSNYYLIAAKAIYGENGLAMIRYCQNIIGGINLLILASENYLPIRTSKVLKEKGVQSMINYCTKTTFKILLLMLLIITSIYFLYPYIFKYIYNKNDPELLLLFPLFLILPIFNLLNFSTRTILRSIEYLRPVFSSYLVMSVINFLIAYPIIQSFGLKGVVLGYAISHGAMLLWYILSIKFKKADIL